MTYVKRVVEISNKRGHPLTIDASKTWIARPVIVSLFLPIMCCAHLKVICALLGQACSIQFA